jgi:hypothetical protein
MNSRSLSSLMIALFVVVGGILLGLRYRARERAQMAEENSRWRLTYQVSFAADEAGAEVRIWRPFNTRHCDILSEEFTYPKLNAEQRGPFAETGNRELRVSARRAANHPYRVTADFELQLSPSADTSREPPLQALDQDARQRLLRDEPAIPVLSDSVRNVIQRIPDDVTTRSEKLQWIFNYCAGIGSTADDALDGAKEALDNRRGSPLAWARAMTALCRAIGVPARLVTGFDIKQQTDVKPRVWVEVFERQKWVPFDPQYGYSRYLPPQFVPVHRGGDDVVRATGASNVQEEYSIERIGPPDSVLRSEVPRPMQILDLTRLPVPMHKVMKILLLLPFGALITSLIRNVVGIRTFGTFSPALLAMSFIYANWETGLAILIVVVTAGLTGRFMLERLRLLMVPRLSIILTLVIMCVVFGVSLFDYIGATPGPQAVLLPMVIMTMLVERFYVSTEEDGLVYSIQLGIGTIIVAVMCYLMLGWDDVGQFVLKYPEAHFFTIAVFIMLGRYAGYRLTELWRFRDLVHPSETPR